MGGPAAPPPLLLPPTDPDVRPLLAGGVDVPTLPVGLVIDVVLASLRALPSAPPPAFLALWPVRPFLLLPSLVTDGWVRPPCPHGPPPLPARLCQ
jgi:hypothetical protein